MPASDQPGTRNGRVAGFFVPGKARNHITFPDAD